MATVKEITNKNGSVSYEIRVSLGRDINGKQILKYHTWTPEPGMTPRKIENALEREKVVFEDKCRSGQVLDTKTRFADFAEYWLSAKKSKHSPKYQQRARGLLERINLGIGHLKIGDIQPHHLRSLYDNLAESGVKKTHQTAVARDLDSVLKERKITRKALAEASGVSPMTITTARQRKRISAETAKKIASALGMSVDDLFVVYSVKEALSDESVAYHHRIISSVLGFAVEEDIISANPALRKVSPRVESKEAAYLDDLQIVEVGAALSAAPLKWRTMVLLLVYSGMRRGEACGLTWGDVDFANHLVHIKKASQYLPEMGIFEKATKNKNSVRTIKLPPEMFSLLEEYREWQNEELSKIGDLCQRTDKVFTQWNGRPIHPDSVTGWIAKFRKANNLPYFSPHTLRHTSATLLILRGENRKAISDRLGHANENTTNKIYSHAIRTADAMLSEIAGDILRPMARSAAKRTG